MPNPLLDEAAHLLELEPTGTLEADRLYARVRHGAPAGPTLAAFIESLRLQPERFIVVAASHAPPGGAGWSDRDRAHYEGALQAAGAPTAVIALAEQAHDVFGLWSRPAATESAAVLHDLHEAVSHVVRASRDDGPLYDMAARAIEELHAVRRALPT